MRLGLIFLEDKQQLEIVKLLHITNCINCQTWMIVCKLVNNTRRPCNIVEKLILQIETYGDSIE